MFINKKIIACTVLASFAFFPFGMDKKEEKGWSPFYIPWNYCRGSKVDVSFLLDGPAGKRGFVTVRDGHFYFEDGTRARFWGVNIHSNKACFPTRGQAEDVAKRLAQLGCNIVRMHLLDNPSPHGIIDSDYNDSQHFSDSQMERLDYFIYQLKKNGIYVTFDVLGVDARKFKSGDGVIDYDKISCPKGISIFDKKIIELSKRFALDFLSHVNPYTGNSYLDEPAIAMIGMTNENTLFADWIRAKFTPYYKKEIEGLWLEWLAEKNHDTKSAHHNWFDDREFMFELENRHHREMYDYLRSIGVKVPIGSSNTPHDNLDLVTDSAMDFTDIHPYWDLAYRSERIHNRPLIKQSPLNPYTIVNLMSRAKVKDKPLMLTEWGTLWPNDWRAVDMLSTASYAALNDLDALFFYSYNGGWAMSWDNLEKKLYYDTVIFNDPAKMGLFPLGALIFLRGDVRTSLNTYGVSYSLDKLFNMVDPHADRMKLAGIMYASRLEKDFYESEGNDSGSQEIGYPRLPELSEEHRVTSDTGEIIRDPEKGVFILETPRTVSFSGFTGRQKKQEFEGLGFYTESDFATFTATSLDGRDIVDSRHLLIAAVGRVRNKDQRLAPHITKEHDDLKKDVYILNKGKGPILVEGIDAKVVIKGKGRSFRVFSLDEKGLRREEIPVERDNNGYRFNISGRDNTIYYEIVRK